MCISIPLETIYSLLSIDEVTRIKEQYSLRISSCRLGSTQRFISYKDAELQLVWEPSTRGSAPGGRKTDY